MKKETQHDGGLLEVLPFWFISAVALIVPILFIPFLSVPFQFSKTLVLFVLVLLSFFLFLITQLKRGSIAFPKHPLIFAVWAIPVAYFISALFSSGMGLSLAGSSFQVDTFGFVALSALLMTLTALLFTSKKRILQVYIALFISFALLALFQLLRVLFGADFLAFGILTDSTANLLGKWNDLAIFFGMTGVLSLLALEGLRVNPGSKVIFWVSLLVSLFFLALVNFLTVWVVVGLFSLTLFVFLFSVGKKKDGNRAKSFSVASAVVLGISVIFIFLSGLFSPYLSSFFNVGQIEARPSWQSTFSVARATYGEHPLLGSGPNTFVAQWIQHKPEAVQSTLFWDADFTSGVGYIPTAAVTTGAAGLAAWIFFLISFLYLGFRGLVVEKGEDGFGYWLSLSTFTLAAYLWIFSIVYVPNTVLLVLAFFFTGLFFATLRERALIPERTVSFLENPRVGFVSVFVLIVILLGSALSLYAIGTRYTSAVYFQKAVLAFNSGDIEGADGHVNRALRFYASDRLHRFAADISLYRLGNTLTTQEGSPGALQAQFEAELQQALFHGSSAVEKNRNFYQNWITLGNVYQSVVPLEIPGAYENAKIAFEQAWSQNNSPVVPFALARLEVLNGNTELARQYIAESLKIKQDYTPAVFLLSQIEVQEGNISEAISSVEAATVLSPGNPAVYFQLGFLAYSDEQFTRAIEALTHAVDLNQNYSNARYFLGLSQYALGDTGAAIAQFEHIERLNPENTEVAQILANLREGESPFAGVTATADTLPIEE